MSVRVETNVGDFEVHLFCKDAPKACFNFLKLCKLNYYSYSIFLRLEAGFLLQGGDPSNTGKGGESIWGLLNPGDKSARFFASEIDIQKRRHDLRGTLSMASAGKDKNASQFFFTLADNLDFLDGSCVVLGQLIDAKMKIESLPEDGLDAFFEYFNQVLFCDEKHRPLQDVYIIKTVVLEDPFPDPEGFDELKAKLATLPQPGEAFRKHKRIGADEKLDLAAGKSEAEIEAERRAQEAKSNALILEIIGDLPSADVKPPENVLFVCKLNPVTRSDDLEMIFSRFGKIISCEVIRDRETGDSLGYAFIEFETEKACEQAYLKMDNVLIDDRRIRVDFSQSVAKLHKKWEDEQRRKRTVRPQVRQRSRSPQDRRSRNCSRSQEPRDDCYRK